MAEVVTSLLYRNGQTSLFGTSDYRNILSEQPVVAKQDRHQTTKACPVTDLFRYVRKLSRVEQLGKDAEHVCGCLTVGDLAEGAGHISKGRGHFAPFSRTPACEFINPRRSKSLHVRHASSPNPCGLAFPHSMTQARSFCAQPQQGFVPGRAFQTATPFAPRKYATRTTNMVMREGIPAAAVVVFTVLWLLWLPVVMVVALVQKRTIGLAILFGMLLGPFGFYFFPRLPPRKPRTPGWYPYWYPNNYRHRYWDGQGWTDDYVSSWRPLPSGPPKASRPSAPPGWYPNPDGTGGQRWWNGETWGDRPRRP